MASTGSIATTLAPTRDTLSSSQLLSTSISSLSNSPRHASSQISKIYRQSSTLFLTRRLPESLSTILPVITPLLSDDTNARVEPAPIATASRTTRIKVWSLYLTILNAVVELNPDEGKQAFGSQEWRALVTKVRDGQVWEEVVNNGYGGSEGSVDSDVVINLATLLLAHAHNQKVNQHRLETYLASSHSPQLDLSHIPDPSSRRNSRTLSPHKRASHGTDTPRDLNTRVKILELYALHVLLRNNEWDLSRDFITMSEVLDDERREAFLQALQSLREEQDEAVRREGEQRRYHEEQLRRDNEEARRRRVENEERERKRMEDERTRINEKKAASSETDYGVENTHPTAAAAGHSRARSSRGSAKGSRSSQVVSPTARPSNSSAKKSGVPPSMLDRAAAIVGNLRALLENMAIGFSTRPLFLMQTLAFVIGLLVVLSRRDVKEVLRRAWAKVKGTAGMGVKVSYI